MGLIRKLTPWLWGFLPLVLLHASRDHLFGSSQWDFGTSLNFPTPGHGRFLALWLVLAGFSSVLLARAWLCLPETRRQALIAPWAAISERRWMIYCALFAFLIPAVLRTFLLHGAPLTDDETAYTFMAETLAGGRLYAESPPLKLFFDHPLMINDGKLFAQYFIGWPALMALGVPIGIAGFMAALLSALTVPALFLVSARLAGPSWARLVTVLYLTSPMLMVTAAGATSHTACLAALAWLTWLCLRARDHGAPWWIHALVAATFVLAFFIRPTSALGIGLPLLGAWLWQLRSNALAGGWRTAAGPLLAFALPSFLGAGMFLAVNQAQTGDPWQPAYHRAYTYAQENDFRFSSRPAENPGGSFVEMRPREISSAIAVQTAAAFRLGVALFGWPCSFLFALFAGLRGFRALLAGSVGCYFAVHFFVDNVGIDTFAPMHYVEVSWPLMVLTACGLQRLTTVLQPFADALPTNATGAAPTRWPQALVVGLVITALTSYTPVRLAAVERIADDIARPFQTLKAQGIERAVIFVRKPFVGYCSAAPALGWVFNRPNNDPDLQNPILWVNHLTLEKNRLLMSQFPDRQGYVLATDKKCRVLFIPLDRVPPDFIPDAEVSGIDQVGIDQVDIEPAGGQLR